MRVLFLTWSVFFNVLLGAALARPQPPDTGPAPVPKAGEVVRGLGRAKPVANYDHGDYKAVRGSDGKTRYFPRLSPKTDLAKLAAAIPESCDWSVKAPAVVRRMYLNDRYGCCVLSSRYHQVGFMTGADTPAGPGLEGTDAEVYAAYQSACGRGDNGCDMSAVNQYQQTAGLSVAGVTHKTRGSVSVDHTNKTLVMGAIYYGGGLNVGMSLPNSWYQSADKAVWDVTNTAIVGGHEVQAFGFNPTGVLISTWAGTRTITWAAFTSNRWIDEVYVTLTPDWYGSDKLAPNGVDVAGLEAAFAAIAGGTVPPLPDPTPPVPPTPVPPPVPGVGFTGTISVTTTYKSGVPQGAPVTTVTGVKADYDGADLKAVGVSPVLIADILKLLADVRTKQPRSVLLADLTKLILDLGLGEPSDDPRRAPTPVPMQMPATIPPKK